MEDYILGLEQIGKDITIGIRGLDEIVDNIKSISEDFEALKSKIETMSYNLENDTTVNFENIDIKEYIYHLQSNDTNGGLNFLIEELKFIKAIN